MVRSLSFVLAAVLVAPAVAPNVFSQAPESSNSAIVLHRRFGACELVQKGTLLSEDGYALVRLDGVSESIYSPELGSDDFIGDPVGAPQNLTKLARKSGFRMKAASDAELSKLPKVLGSPGTASDCSSVEEALQRVERDGAERRQRLQSKVFQAGSNGVSQPEAISTPQPKVESRNANPSLQPAQPTPKAKAKLQGTAILSCIVAINGDVEQVKVVRSLSGDLDKKALETVATWKFRPARKNGLPVPVEIHAEVNFNLY
jgi:TonB family protein